MMNFINDLIFRFKMMLMKFFLKEDGAVDMVAIIILIAVVIIVAFTFKTELRKLVEHLFSGIGQKADNDFGLNQQK